MKGGGREGERRRRRRKSRKGFVSENEEGVSGWGVQHRASYMPGLPSAMWSGGRGGCLPEKKARIEKS